MNHKKLADATAAAKEVCRIIKKYPNRRLYDTESSSYVTLTQVKCLVMENQPFVVRDVKTGTDLTRSVLLQIILEEEAGGSPMFTEAVLASMIRFYGQAMQGLMGGYLEKNIQALLQVQTRMGDQTKAFTPEMWSQFMTAQAPALQGMMGASVEQSNKFLAQMQEQMQKQTSQVLGAFGLTT